jgi:hypothetical protein
VPPSLFRSISIRHTQMCLVLMRRYFSPHLHLPSLPSLPSLLQFYLPCALSTPVVKHRYTAVFCYCDGSTLSCCTCGDSAHFLSVGRNVVPDCRHSRMAVEHFVDSMRHRGNLFFTRHRSFGTRCARDDYAFLVASLPLGTCPLLRGRWSFHFLS